MSSREQLKIRKLTNLYDLLDDGIENGSDLPELARLQAEDGAGTATPSAPAPPRGDRPAEPVPSRRSWGGVLLGAAFIAGGGAAALWPSELMVWHDRINYLPSFVEHVTRAGARGYGVAVTVGGLVVLVVSLLRLPGDVQR